MPDDISARTKFIAGPASATRAMSRLGFFSAAKFTGTGFAQPNMNGARVKISSAGKITVPTGSTCRNGFKDSLFARFAVASPHIKAAYPCAISCRTIARNSGSALTQKAAI